MKSTAKPLRICHLYESFQAEVAGCSVTWLVPHQLAQVLPPDVDFTVMLTFLEFYATLVQFVMFKLYHNLGLR
jgi:pescadillo protein